MSHPVHEGAQLEEIDGEEAPSDRAPPAFGLRRAFVAALALAGAVALYVSGAFDEPEATVQLVRDAGMAGVMAYLAAFALLQPFGISGHAFTLAAAVVWGGATGFAIAMAGALGSASVAFVFARYLAYDWVQSRIPERVRRLEKWLVDRGLLGVVVFRTLTFTAPPALFLVGAMRIPYPRMLLGTAIGFVPALAIDIFLGGELWALLTR